VSGRDNRLKEALAAGRTVYGTWLSLASPLVAEALALAGFDFLVIDGEHAPNGVTSTLAQLQAVAAGGGAAVVRVPWNDPVAIKRALDIGARSLLVPMVRSAEEARQAVRAALYPPDGIRGVGSLHRAGGYGLTPDYLSTAGEGIAVIVQIETAGAVEAAEAIAGTAGIACMFVGPSDLAASLGQLGNPGHADVQSAIATVLAAAGRRDVPAGVLARDAAEARRYAAMGFRFVAVGADVSFMLRQARASLDELRARES